MSVTPLTIPYLRAKATVGTVTLRLAACRSSPTPTSSSSAPCPTMIATRQSLGLVAHSYTNRQSSITLWDKIFGKPLGRKSPARCDKSSEKSRVEGESLEVRLKTALRDRAHLDTAISWVRSHIGIPGNKAADQAADWQSHLGPIAGLPSAATYEGLRAHHKAIRKQYRGQPSLGLGRRVLWSRKALSAYTWMRTNRGPQLEWLHRIGKTDSPLCPCGEIQSGDHVIFHCTAHRVARTALLGPTDHTWEALDTPRYDPDDDEEEKTDLVEEFFSYIFAHFS